MMARIHALLHGSRANGPGLRSVVFFQGCPIRCPGCWNHGTWDSSGGREHYPEDLAALVDHGAMFGTEGLTVSGGEPLSQAPELLDFLLSIRDRRPYWSLGVFTGYTEPELLRIGEWAAIREMLDFAVIGPWDRTRPAGPESFVTSTNQVLRLWGSRYSEADFQRIIEFGIGPEGLTTISGFPVR